MNFYPKDFEKILILREDLKQVLDIDKIEKINFIKFSKRLFDSNAKELINKLNWAKRPENFYQMWMYGNRPYLYSFQYEIIRLLQNFITSAMVLVAHSRRFHVENYKNNDEFRDYETEVGLRFKKHPVIQFVHKLRNYYEHYSPTIIGVSLSPTSEEHSKHRIYLQKQDLLKWKGWNNSAQIFLDGSENEIEILDFIVEYCNSIDGFHDWIFSRFLQIHKESLIIINELQTKINLIASKEFPTLITESLEIVKEGRGNPEDIFGNVISPDKFSELLQIESWESRYSRFLIEVQIARKLPLKLIEDIYNTFNQFYNEKK